jgi:hypothetical protein
MKKLLFITTFFFSLIISAQNEDKQISNVFNNGTIYKDGSDDCTDPANYEIPGQWVVYANYCLNQFRFWNGVSWSEWGNSGGGGSANNYVDSASFDDLTGNLRLTRLGLSPITTNLDGRYLISESQTATDVPFTPYLTITSANLQLAFQELKDEIDAIDLSVIATNVSITDTGDYFTSNNIEGALQELGLDVSNLIAGGSDGNDYVTSGTVIADTLRLTITNQPDVDILVPTLLENTQLTPEQVQDIIGSFIVDGTNTIVNYNDVANTLQINSNQSLPANQIGYGNGSTIVGNAGFSYDPSNFTITSVGNAITGTLTMSPLEIKGEGGIGQNSMRFWRDGIIWTAASSSPIIGIANTVTDPLGSLGYKVLNFDVVEGEHNIYVPARNGAITMALTDGNTTLDTPITGVLDISPLLNGLGDVTSVNTQTGDVVLDADDIDDTSTTNKFATAQQLANIAINESDITALQNNKQDNLTLTTNGTSGAATLVGSTLNIPNYDTSGGTVDNTILTTSLTTDRTLAVSDINDFNIFTIDAAGLTLTIPQTTLATGEIKFITFLAPNEASFTVAGDTGVTVPSPSTFSGLRVVTLYSTTEDVWLLYNSEEDAGGGISGVETQDEGVQVDADATTLNFVGAGVSATDAGNGVTTVTISGGGGGGFNQTTFNGQDVHFIKHPDNVGSEFEDYDFITNYVENDTIYQLAQYRGGGQSAANLDGIEKVFIGSSRFDIPVLDLILNGTFDDSSNLTVGANWTIGGGVATFDDVTNSELDFALSSNLLPNTEYIFKTTANSPTSDQVRWQLAGLESASETEIVVYDFYDEGTVFNRFTTGLGTDYDTLRLRASSSAPAPFTIDDVILQEDSYDKGILTNGTFDDATGLTLDASLTVSGGKLQFDDTTFGYAIFDLDTPMVAGKTYRLRVDVEYGTASFSRIRLYGTNDGTTSNMFNLFGLENREPEKLDFVFTAPVETSVNTQLIIYFSDGTNGTLSIDNVGLTELTP